MMAPVYQEVLGKSSQLQSSEPRHSEGCLALSWGTRILFSLSLLQMPSDFFHRGLPSFWDCHLPSLAYDSSISQLPMGHRSLLSEPGQVTDKWR